MTINNCLFSPTLKIIMNFKLGALGHVNEPLLAAALNEIF